MDFIKVEFNKNKKFYGEFLKKVKKYKRIVIFRHIMPDFDCLGCQFGLETWLKENFKDKEIKTAGDNHVVFSGKLFPEVNKLSDTYLSSEPFLGIICDVGDKKRIADPRFEKADYILKIDHHPCDEVVYDDCLVQTEKSSCSEIIAAMLLYFEKKGYTISKKASHYLYIGMVGDNGRFLFGSTSPFTLEIGAELLNKGIDLVKLYEGMYTKDLNSLEFIKFVISNYKITKHGVCYYVLTQDDLNKLKLTCDQGKEYVNFFSNYEGINIWISVTEDVTEPCFRVSLRSRNYRVNQVAKEFKGGGHAQAAGAQIKDLSELPSLLERLDEVVIKGEK